MVNHLVSPNLEKTYGIKSLIIVENRILKNTTIEKKLLGWMSILIFLL